MWNNQKFSQGINVTLTDLVANNCHPIFIAKTITERLKLNELNELLKKKKRIKLSNLLDKIAKIRCWITVGVWATIL